MTNKAEGVQNSEISIAPWVRPLVNFLGFIQLLLGVFGFYGNYLYFDAPLTNHSRYQFLHVPVFSFIIAIPFLAVAAYFHRNCKPLMSTTEEWLFNLGCAMPLVALAVAIAQ